MANPEQVEKALNKMIGRAIELIEMPMPKLIDLHPMKHLMSNGMKVSRSNCIEAILHEEFQNYCSKDS